MRKIVMGLATLALVIATMGAATAAAQGTGAYESRAEFIYQLDVQLGIAPIYPATGDFSDVLAGNPYYGYIEAAYQKGFVSGLGTPGLFGPNEPLTRAQAAKILVEAYGAGQAAQGVSSTNFSDNGRIPASLVGFVGEAVQLGLMQGVTTTTFAPGQYLTQNQMNDLLRHLIAAKAGTTLSLTASANDVAPGTAVTLTTSGKTAGGGVIENPAVTYTVTSSNAAEAILSGSTFAASAAGNYVVQAALGSATASVTISVYGTPAALVINPPKDPVVANGASQQTLTVDVVDGNNNVVADSSDLVQLSTGTASVLGLVDSSGAVVGNTTVNATNGVATFTVQSGIVPGGSTTLTAADNSTAGIPNGTLDVASVAQTATSLSAAAASPYLEANDAAGQDQIAVQVLDQTGEPMLYGTYGFSGSVAGPAVFDSTQTTSASSAYTGNGSAGASAPSATLTLDGQQSNTGAISVTVSASGLTSASASLTAVITGAAAALELVPPASTSFSEDDGATGLTYGIQAVDANGYPVPLPSGVTGFNVTVLNSAGTAATNIQVDGTSMGTGGVLDTTAVGSGQIQITDDQSGADAGTYTLQVADATGTLASSATTSFTETAGAMYMVNSMDAAMAWQSVNNTTVLGYESGVAPASNPSRTVTVQLMDQYFNPIATAGVPIYFDASDGCSDFTPKLTSSQGGVLTLGATTPSLGPALELMSNAQGQATATITGEPYTDSYYCVDIWSPDTPYTNQSNTGNAEVGFDIANTLTQKLQLQFQDTSSTSQDALSQSQAVVGDPVSLNIAALDQNNFGPDDDDVLQVSFSGSGSLQFQGAEKPGDMPTTAHGNFYVTLYQPANNNSDSAATLDYTATGSGPVTVTVTDLSLPTPVTATATFNVQSGPVTAFSVLDSAGNDASTGVSVTANQPTAFTLTPVDAMGNPAIADANYLVPLESSGAGSFRTTQGGTSVSTATVPAGSSGVTVYYVDPLTHTVNLSDRSHLWVSYPNGSTLNLQPGGTLDLTGDASGSWSAVSGTFSTATGTSTIYTAPASGTGTDTITYTNSSGTMQFTVNY